MPVLERRKLTKTGKESYIICLPKDWVRFFGLKGGEELDMIADMPVVVFPPQVSSKEQRIDALKKIITLIEATPERPFPRAKKERKKRGSENGSEHRMVG
jgi:phosphate uptake regulator